MVLADPTHAIIRAICCLIKAVQKGAGKSSAAFKPASALTNLNGPTWCSLILCLLAWDTQAHIYTDTMCTTRTNTHTHMHASTHTHIHTHACVHTRTAGPTARRRTCAAGLCEPIQGYAGEVAAMVISVQDCTGECAAMRSSDDFTSKACKWGRRNDSCSSGFMQVRLLKQWGQQQACVG